MTERPTFSECVVGYRSWKLADWVLAPVSFGNPWRPGVNHAVCKAADTMWTIAYPGEPQSAETHSAPQQQCTCGLHAYHEIPEDIPGQIIGAVAAWGDLQVHYNGFRAEHAQILALVAAPGLEDVAALYGVPLVPRDMLAAEAQQHGSPLPESMRPAKPAVDPNALYQQMFAQPLYFGPSTMYTWVGTSTSPLWTPDDDEGKTPDDKLAKYLKKPSNRQGPPRPKRGPKGSWSGR